MTITVRDVSRVFVSRNQPERVALRRISFDVHAGEIFGVIGPNGAGKTTMVSILSTLLLPTSGSVSISGIDVISAPKAVRRRIGTVFGGERGLYDRLTARDNLKYAAQLHGVPWRQQSQRVDELLHTVDLADRAGARVETFSRGMKQRLHIARALINDPDVILLDEPSAGLDPLAARSMRALITSLRSRGKTMVLTTHDMYEADALCDRIAVIVDGEICLTGSPESVKDASRTERVIEVDVFGDVRLHVERFREFPGVISVELTQSEGSVERMTIRLSKSSTLHINEILQGLSGVATGAPFERAPSLEDAYVSIVQAAR